MKDTFLPILITGTAGFIGSQLVEYLNKEGYKNIYLVDDFSIGIKKKNWQKLSYTNLVERSVFFEWLAATQINFQFILHMGAKTDTTEFDYGIHKKLNLDFSISLWQYCVEKNIPFIYASSAATYGDGAFGYDDKHEIVKNLKPLNAYGISKNEFDKWVLQETQTPPFWAGLKFFNVYGPNEYHKGRMASVIWHAYNQIKATQKMKLFRSHKAHIKDGEQLRDFIYVKDICSVIFWMMEEYLFQKPILSGLYNLGTGTARTFKDLVMATFNAMEKPIDIEFIDMPIDIRDKYQYYTQANMQKLAKQGYTKGFYSLEEGIQDYVKNYLKPNFS